MKPELTLKDKVRIVVASLSNNGKLCGAIPVFTARQTICKAMEEYASQPKWISVKERLPKEGVKVIALAKESETMGTTVWRKNTLGDELWFMYNFSHWQPQLKLPKK